MAVPGLATVRERLTSALIGAASPSGGWGYASGLASRLEPTCWALLALRPTDLGSRHVARHLDWLRSLRRADGLLSHAGQPPNVAFNGVAVLVLLDEPSSVDPQAQSHRAMARQVVGGMLHTRGVPGRESPVSGHDDTLRGWPWLPGTASWVEPTAWCLLAVSRYRRVAADTRGGEVVDEARRLLIDRTCEVGGWNCGTPRVFGTSLPPYVAPTSLTILALQDEVSHPVVAKALSRLRATWADEPSSIALALTSLAFEVVGQPHEEVDAALAALTERPGFSDRLVEVGMSLYALTAGIHHAAAFRL